MNTPLERSSRAAAPSPSSPWRELALVQLGELCVAIPIDQVRQAWPRPASLQPLPRRDHALLGVMQLEGQSLPVVDLARWVDIPPAPASQAGAERILVLQCGERQVGLLVQGVQGVRRVPTAAVQRLSHTPAPEEVFDALVQIEGLPQGAQLLEVSRLMDLAQVWHQAEAPAQGHAGAADLNSGDAAPAARAQRYAVLRLGQRLLGFPAVTLGELRPRPVLQPFGHSPHTGIAQWRGRHLPVLDLGTAWPPEGPRDSPPWLLVLCHGELAVGVLLHELRDMVSLRPADRHAAPQALAELGYVQGLAQDANGDPIFLIDVAALIAVHPESQISRLPVQTSERAPAGASGQHASSRTNEQPYLVFEAGALLCTPVSGVQEILALRPEQVPAPGQTPAPFAWRGQWLDLIDLPGRLRPRHRAARAPSHVLVVQQAQRCQGFLIEEVRSIVPTGRAPLSQLNLGQDQPVEFLTLGAPPEQRSARRIDLRQEAV
ncbi:chemotaxis protein CheW [Curvibacter sp. HBC28]|uniref:Chemotaxis protein CheW n=1 Tax=Curvibacter microcysteis TaxID=3026419 RepID=A0ABT5MHF0_9BURK|nr:chemotaxis protein CheW [Curvibacter sp. HBC28]MDD0816009.1 chemotaxis protein CheW [Curvibacter sp. HBC28]